MGAAVRAASGRPGRRPGPRPAFSGILSWELLMKKRNWLAACAAVALQGALCTPWPAQASIRIGAVLPLTGPSATIGEDIRRGIMLGVDEVNANGGVLGKKLALIVEDSANNPTTALTAARKLATVDKVPAVIGEYSSSITLPMAQYL